ncbi:MAG: hypothetical protein JXB05_17330 [Myxococcaceae bacterium]|nr:hypothetical protein [Myxococcaceae bacterium]
MPTTEPAGRPPQRHVPRKEDLWNAVVDIPRVHHHEFEIAGVGVKEAVNRRGHGGRGWEIHGLEVDDRLESLRISQPGDRGEIEGEPRLLTEDERGAEVHGVGSSLSQPHVPRDEMIPLGAGRVEREGAELSSTGALIYCGELRVHWLIEDGLSGFGSGLHEGLKVQGKRMLPANRDETIKSREWSTVGHSSILGSGYERRLEFSHLPPSCLRRSC